MKRKWMYRYVGLTAAAVIGMAGLAAAEETESITEAVITEETENAAEEMIGGDVDIKLAVDKTEIIIANESKVKIDSAEAEKNSDTDEKESSFTVILTAEDHQHTFERVDPELWTEPRLVEEHGFLYIQYTDAEGNSKEAAETAEAIPGEEMSVWAVTDVNMRAEASADSDVVTVVRLGDECKVLELLPGWYHVEYNEASGYINHRFLSDDKEKADAAVQQEEAAAAAAAAAQQSTYSYSYSGSGKKSSGKKSSGSKSSSKNKTQEECLTNGILN